jgi:hypothetical protein
MGSADRGAVGFREGGLLGGRNHRREGIILA